MAEQPEKGQCPSYFEMLEYTMAESFSIMTKWLHWLGLESDQPLDGPAEFSDKPGGQMTTWSCPVEITSTSAEPIRLHTTDCRQIGGGEPIPSAAISFKPEMVQQGSTKVMVTVQMADMPVGMWIGNIVSPDGHLMTSEPILPTWAS